MESGYADKAVSLTTAMQVPFEAVLGGEARTFFYFLDLQFSLAQAGLKLNVTSDDFELLILPSPFPGGLALQSWATMPGLCSCSAGELAAS